MNERRAFDLLVEMNPVPHPETLDVSLVDERSGDMQTVQRIDPTVRGWESPKAPPRRGWLPALAAAVVVVVVGAGIWFLGAGDREFTGGDTARAKGTEALLGAFNAGDYEAFRAPFREDVALSGVNGWRFLTTAVTEPPSVAPSSFGFQLVGRCTEVRPRHVRCDIAQRGGVFDRIGVSIDGVATVLYDDAGAIYVMSMDSHLQFNGVTILREFTNWLRAEHRDLFDATFESGSVEAVPPNGVDTVDNRAIWSTVVGDFVEQRPAG
jgi:hypothetical protein